MRLTEILKEKNEEKGTYAGVRFSQDDEDVIVDLVKEMGLPNPIEKEEIHLTLLYSRKQLPNYKPATSTDMWAYPKGFHIFTGGNGKAILVLKLDAPALHKRHIDLMKEHGATYDFPEYIPHITLSYDVGDMDLKDIQEKFTELLPKEFHINAEYKEDLNLDWETKD